MDELERLRQRVQQLEQELAETQENVIRGLHEMTRPLVPVYGFIPTLLEDKAEAWYAPEDRREFYEIIHDSLDRLERLRRLLCNGFHREAGFRAWEEETDIHAVTTKVLLAWQTRSDKHKITLDLDPEPIHAEVDAEILAGMLHVLLKNAVRFSPQEGEIRLVGRLEVPCEAFPSGAFMMQVKDQSGLTMEDRMLFERRFINPPYTEGFLLRLLKNILESHHGAFWSESAGRGKEATFGFRIPLKQPQAAFDTIDG